MDGWMDGSIDRWMDGTMDGCRRPSSWEISPLIFTLDNPKGDRLDSHSQASLPCAETVFVMRDRRVTESALHRLPCSCVSLEFAIFFLCVMGNRHPGVCVCMCVCERERERERSYGCLLTTIIDCRYSCGCLYYGPVMKMLWRCGSERVHDRVVRVWGHDSTF